MPLTGRSHRNRSRRRGAGLLPDSSVGPGSWFSLTVFIASGRSVPPRLLPRLRLLWLVDDLHLDGQHGGQGPQCHHKQTSNALALLVVTHAHSNKKLPLWCLDTRNRPRIRGARQRSTWPSVRMGKWAACASPCQADRPRHKRQDVGSTAYCTVLGWKAASTWCKSIRSRVSVASGLADDLPHVEAVQSTRR